MRTLLLVLSYASLIDMNLPLILWSRACFHMLLGSFGLIGFLTKHGAPQDKLSCSISFFMFAEITVEINQTHTKVGKELVRIIN